MYAGEDADSRQELSAPSKISSFCHFTLLLIQLLKIDLSLPSESDADLILYLCFSTEKIYTSQRCSPSPIACHPQRQHTRHPRAIRERHLRMQRTAHDARRAAASRVAARAADTLLLLPAAYVLSSARQAACVIHEMVIRRQAK